MGRREREACKEAKAAEALSVTSASLARSTAANALHHMIVPVVAGCLLAVEELAAAASCLFSMLGIRQ